MPAKTSQKPAKPKLLSGGNPHGMQGQGWFLSLHCFDEARLAGWVKQASKLPGWGGS